MTESGMTYAGSGVDYDSLDPFKRAAQLAARETSDNIRRFGMHHPGRFRELEASRGESAYLIETSEGYLAHVEEGLGTKNLVADTMYELTGKSYYDHIAQDTVAMIVNDMITLGALPLCVAMHLGVGDSNWFEDEIRSGDLIRGWRHACDLAQCAWGGGETPTLKDIIVPGRVVLSGSAMGMVRNKYRLIKGNIAPGDAIILIQSSGIHANGLTMARKIADKLPEGYLTRLSDGRTYGETLLDPTEIYVALIAQCLYGGVRIHYAVNITGHGWRKLMRLPEPFVYIIERLPKQLPIFDFIQEHGPVDDREAYGNLNMGAGFALYVPQADVSKVFSILNEFEDEKPRWTAIEAGFIAEGKEKLVFIQPKELTFKADTLAVR